MSKRVIFIVLGIIVLLVGGGIIYTRNLYSQVVVKPKTTRKIIVNATPTPTPDPLAPYNIALLGYGGPLHDGGFLTDTIIVAHIEPKEQTITLISIPRDIWIKLPLTDDGVSYKINAAYALGNDKNQYLDRPEEFTGKAGGGQLAKYALEKITGLPIHHFIALSFDGFTQSIDALGGISINVPHMFNDNFYPIPEEKENNCDKSEEEIEELTATLSGQLLEEQFPCRYEHLHFDKGIQHMDGETALKFVRSRKSETYGGDYNRSLRQQALLKAVKDKVISVNFIPKAVSFMGSLASNLQTDIDASVVATKLKNNPDPGKFTIYTISLTSDNVLVEDKSEDGQYILATEEGINQWKPVHTYLEEELGKIHNPTTPTHKSSQ